MPQSFRPTAYTCIPLCCSCTFRLCFPIVCRFVFLLVVRFVLLLCRLSFRAGSPTFLLQDSVARMWEGSIWFRLPAFVLRLLHGVSSHKEASSVAEALSLLQTDSLHRSTAHTLRLRTARSRSKSCPQWFWCGF